MPFYKPDRDRARLRGVHPHLVAQVELAAEMCPVPFTVVEGVRTVEQQRKNVAAGKSKTMNSRHIPAPNGFGHAVDLVVINAKGEADWDGHAPIEKAMKAAAKELGYPIEWGGDWKGGWDSPHWQLPWGAYPGTKPLAKSRTLAGAGMTSLGLMGEPVSQAAAQLQPLVDYSEAIRWAFIALSVIGVALVIYARVTDQPPKEDHDHDASNPRGD